MNLARLPAVLAAAAVLMVPASQADATGKGRQTSPIARANSEALRQPSAGSYVNAKQVYLWEEGAIYQLHAAPWHVSDIALQAGETLISVGAGDTARWQIGDTASGSGPTRRTHLLVKPTKAGLATNMVIATDRRTYHLALSSSEGPAMAAIAWSYPLDELIALRRQAEAVAASSPVAPLNIERLNFGYRIKGDRPSWRPLRAFDDGRQVFIQFPEEPGRHQAPPLFLLGPRGEVRLVNYRVKGSYYVVDRLFDRAELRLGEKRQQVVRIERSNPSAKRR